MTRSRITNTVLALGALGALSTLSALPAQAASPAEMMQQCRIRAGQTLSMRLPDIDTKYEGQRVDGSHAVNGTARSKRRALTFQCNFNKRGSKITKFIVNKPEPAPAPEPPRSSNVRADCLAAVAKQVGGARVSIISVKRGETSTQVLVKVRRAQKPWRCNHDGRKVLRVMYMGEG